MASWLKRPDVIKAHQRAIRPLHAISDSGKHARGSGVCRRLKSRPPNAIYDKLRHDKSSPYRLLEIALAKFLPDSVNRTLPNQALTPAWHLPAGYHLVFFPPPTASLLADGTDEMHFPGKPWVRRMWAGGKIEFRIDDRRKYVTSKLRQHNSVRCREQIKDAVVKGSVGNEKVWVEIRRAIGRASRKNELSAAEVVDQAAIIESRNLVFMPAKTPEAAIDDVSKPTRIIKRERKVILYPRCYLDIVTDHSTLAIIKPDFSVSMVPDANLLFRFSALTFNAHRIHLDREYARTVEGFRNLVVHGPLSILLMLKVLSSQMGNSETGIPQMVKSITYKNLTPLFADEKMTICVRRQPQAGAASTKVNDAETLIKADNTPEQVGSILAEADSTPAEADSIRAVADSGITKWDVWIENAEGGYAVKGTAETVAAGYVSPSDLKKQVRFVSDAKSSSGLQVRRVYSTIASDNEPQE
ncbi:hypothetical protein VE00_01240 [Pseudogymnoascus sp. WSF 3629]|nr:hypothetical protein VE00_01240 [Pseudogymnoascus sp. WSF 3629]